MSTNAPRIRDYQQTMVDFAKVTPRCFFNVAAGLGKSRAALESLGVEDKVMIVGPAHLRENWKIEIKKWRPELTDNIDVYSYDFFARAKTLKLPKYTVAIVDESTYLKSMTAKRTLVLTQIVLPRIERVMFLSASPIQKSAADLYPILNVMQPDAWGTIHEFQETYCMVRDDHFQGRIYYGVNPATRGELAARWKPNVIKYTKADVASEMLPIVEETIYLQPTKAPKYNYATLDYEHVTAEMKTEYQNIGMMKVPFVMDFIDSSESEPTLIFTHHRRVNEEYVSALAKAGHSALAIVGGDNDKQKKVDLFQSGIVNYLVLSMAAAATGLNLPRAKRVLFGELPWTYTDYMQSMNRAHRLTTQHTVYVHAFALRDTIDEGLLLAIADKRATSDMIVGETDNTIKKEQDYGPTKENTSPRIITNTGAGNSTQKHGGEHAPTERDGAAGGRRCDSGGITGTSDHDGRRHVSTDDGSDPLGLRSPCADPLGISYASEWRITAAPRPCSLSSFGISFLDEMLGAASTGSTLSK